MKTISETRLRRDIEANATFGQIESSEGTGRTVLTGSQANKEARDQFVSKLESAGLSVTIDAVGTIVGRWVPKSADPNAEPVAVGSHLDSVPQGGIFDGPLGVYGALETVRSIQASDHKISRPIDVVCFTEEEGQRFGNGLLGSSVATGRTTAGEALSYEDEDGKTLEEALEEIGYRGDSVVDASEWDSWLELHIEQGTRLEDAGAAAGVVTDITGITHCYIDIEGDADHAGSTPMDCRADALAAASEVVLAIESDANDTVETISPSVVGTVGKLTISPNATNVIPGHARLGIDIRDISPEAIETLVNMLQNTVERVSADRPVEISIERPYMVSPEPMAPRCQEALISAGEELDIKTCSLHSGAAHDTMNIARVTDAGLLFAPSKAGISHNPKEWTEWEDCADATAVLARAVAKLAK
ncbi:Zn-dependent hydrolase [Halorubraceae archaeon YAN]|nr:Zn-dependent hydrolase [Halorubraceae archaeon YAN]